MRYLSVCSGIEAASVAWGPLGWEPWAFAEVDAFPSAVLAHHYPQTPNLGDMAKFQGWPDAAFDVLVGGTPCQSFSVAGLRKGLDDPRGGLLWSYLAIARRYRPRWVVWENVPGVLSVDGGRAFGSLLGGLAELGYGFAFRVLDAQYFGLAQRRRRVFVVGCLGSGPRAAAVLFERASLSGHPAPRREAGQGAAGGAALGAVCNTLTARYGRNGGAANDDVDQGRLVAVAGPGGEDVSHAVSARDGKWPCSNLAQATLVAFADVADPVAANQARTYTREGTGNFRVSNVAISSAAVRRLTPRECERLQGFPDDYTLIPYRGKTAADGPRYKALGNSMAVPVMHWIGRRIQMVEAECSN